MDFAALDIREYVDRVKGIFPEEAEEPLLVKFDPSMLPVIQASFTGENLEELRYQVEEDIQPRLERIAGVASAEVTGGREREIKN